MRRSDHLQRLEQEEFDLCIIGGGASGTGAALDAALRGMKVALVEKTDFAAATSSRSTKLIHGGVRYLEQAFKSLDFSQLRQVQHGLEERHILLRNAPHLAHPLGLITPVSSWWEGLYYFIGLKIYGLFASRHDTLPGSRWLSKKTLLRLMPGIAPNVHSAILYYDGQLDDARYCLALAQSAATAGAAIANHLEVIEFQKDTSGKIVAALVQDNLSHHRFSLRAKRFLNCCGPFADTVRLMANKQLSPRIAPSKGVHLVLPLSYFQSIHAMLIPKTRDGRVVFAIPFEGSLLLGTTDEPYHQTAEEPVLESDEVDFLLETLQPFVSKKVERSDVKAGFGGLRPLVSAKKDKDRTTKTLLRDHEVEQDPHSGLISLLGGKWTTYRLMAKDAIDFVAGELSCSSTCQTADHLLTGAAGWSPEQGDQLAAAYNMPQDIARHLSMKYGSKASDVWQLTLSQPALQQRLIDGQPYIKAEVVYAVTSEMALAIRDVMARRLRIETTDWTAAKACAPSVAELMGSQLGWSSTKKAAELADYLALVEGFERRAGV